MASLLNLALVGFKTHSQVLVISKYKLVPKVLCGKCAVHTSSVQLSFYEKHPKGHYAKLRTKPSHKEIIRYGLQQIKEEIKLWKSEIVEHFEGNILHQGVPGVVDKVFDFKKEDLKKWIVTTDKDNLEGSSTAELTVNQNGKAHFTGNLCLDLPKDGVIKKSGYCNMRTIRKTSSFVRDSYFEWGMYNHLVLRVRGDGRPYGLNLSVSSYFDITWNDMYTYVLHTRGGPYWQYTRIPFSKFFFTSKGRIQDRQDPIPLNRIAFFGITLAERVPGPFSLEIDYIGLENDPSHKEKFAYEMYKLPHGIIG